MNRSAVMGLVLPFVFRPIGVAALKILPAYVITPLINLLFLWMVVIGIVIFGETPGTTVFIGASIMILAGVWLICDQATKWDQVPNRVVPRRIAPAKLRLAISSSLLIT